VSIITKVTWPHLSTFFYIYLSVNIHFQLIILTNVSILTNPAYFVPPSCHCGMLALRSRDFCDYWHKILLLVSRTLREYICLIVLAPDFMTTICKKAAQDFHRAVSKVFDMVKSVALWSANIRTLRIVLMSIWFRVQCIVKK
jgi:hypothetical protein